MKISRDKTNHISSLIIRDFEKRDEIDYKVELNEIRLAITQVMTEELMQDDKADAEARKMLDSQTSRNLREGTPEWDILYQKYYEDYMKKHGF